VRLIQSRRSARKQDIEDALIEEIRQAYEGEVVSAHDLYIF
jgi:hypothetical protein